MDTQKAQKAKRNGNAGRGLYKRVQALKKDESERDPLVDSLRYVARETAQGVRQYGQLRYRHPVTGAWVTKGLGKVPSPAVADKLFEVAQAAADAEGSTRTIRYDEEAFEPIRQKAYELLALVEDGVDPKGAASAQGFTIEQAIDKHITRPRQKALAESTIDYYRKVERLYLKPWAQVPLRKLAKGGSEALLAIYDKLHEKHGRVTAVMSMRLLKAAWETARFYDGRLGAFPKLPEGHLSGNDPKKAPIKPSGLRGWFREVAKVKGQRRDVWLLGILTGLRRADLVTIRREHVTGCTLHIPKPKGGEGKAFDLPLSDAACALVKRVLRSHNSEWLWPSTKSKSGHLEDPDPQTDDGFSVAWTMHDLRRIYASVAAAVVTNGYHLKALMNHALPRSDVTAGYIELEADDLRPSQQAVTDKLRKLGLPL